MKNTAKPLLLTAIMVLALTGCGAADTNHTSRTDQYDANRTETADDPHPTDTDYDLSRDVDRTVKDAEKALKDTGKPTTYRTASGKEVPVKHSALAAEKAAASITVSRNSANWRNNLDQMLKNARVHDTDGDLTDLENSVTPGALG